MKKFICLFLMASIWVVLGGMAWASLIFIPNTYGMSAKSIGLGNAMTAVGDDYSMTYYNPGGLATLDTSQVDIGYLYTAPYFTGGPTDEQGVVFDTRNQALLLGFTMNLSKLFKFKKDYGLGLGFDLAIDNNLKSFLSFEETRNDKGQFARYGISSVTMNLALGLQIIPQLHIGVGGFILVKGTNSLTAETDLAGNTDYEQIQVEAEPAIAPIVGIFAPAHKMVTLGVVWRGKGVAEFTKIDAQTSALVSESKLTDLNLLMAFKDTYVPHQVAFGLSLRPIETLMLAMDVTWANWADYAEEVKEGTVVKEDADFETKDIFIPRLGIEYQPVPQLLYMRFGYYWEETPFVKPGIGDSIVLDNTKHAFSFGLAHDMTYLHFMAHPVTIGFTYFNHYLQPRTVKSDDGGEFESSGNLNGFIASLTLRF